MPQLERVERRILTEESLSRFRSLMNHTGKKVVFTNGCFDILHQGHIQYLAAAADLGDVLIIGLNSDASVSRLKGSGRPINDQQSRSLVLASLRYVDGVVIFDEDTPAELIRKIKPEVLVKGGDYEADSIVGADTVKAYGGEVIILPFIEGFSTTGISEKILQQGK
jgi:rfaE bifunctional protein nucleotidyltransferase chain/domain